MGRNDNLVRRQWVALLALKLGANRKIDRAVAVSIDGMGTQVEASEFDPSQGEFLKE